MQIRFGMTNFSKLAGLAIVSFSAVAFAVFTQQVWDMRPCPWCIIQRAIYICIGLIATLGAVLARTPSRKSTFREIADIKWPWVSVGLLAALGVGSAIYQNLVAAGQASCSVSHAQSFIMATGLDEFLPSLFMVTGTCADAAKLLGIPYEIASAVLFLLIVCWCLHSIFSHKKDLF